MRRQLALQVDDFALGGLDQKATKDPRGVNMVALRSILNLGQELEDRRRTHAEYSALAPLNSTLAKRSRKDLVLATNVLSLAPRSRKVGRRRELQDISEDAVALKLAEALEGKTRWCIDHGSWFRWNGSIWGQDRTYRAFDAARVLCRDEARSLEARDRLKAGKASFVRSVESLCRADSRLNVEADAWDRDAYLLGTPDGTVDLRSGELRSSLSQDGITKSAAVAPSERAECPTWDRFLKQVTGGADELVQFLQRWCGYALTGDIREHALVFLYGPGGNGKSVFVNVLSGILGDYAATASMDTFTVAIGERHPADIAMLRGARLVTATETEEGKPWAEARVKQLTGGDPITARFMRKDPFTFRPAFKLTIAGNHKPVLRNVDHAAQRRLNLIPFLQRFDQPDRQLEAKLRQEWSGILRWAIDGCLAWQRFGGLHSPSAVRDATGEYFADQDVMAQWLDEKCRVELGNRALRETTHALFASYQNFLKERQERVCSIRTFGQGLLQHHALTPLKNVASATGRARGYEGICLL